MTLLGYTYCHTIRYWLGHCKKIATCERDVLNKCMQTNEKNKKSLSQFLRPYEEQILQFTGQKEIDVKFYGNTLFLTYYKKN